MFKLDIINFEIEENESYLLISNDNGYVQFALDISTKEIKYQDDYCSPSLFINFFETEFKNIQQLIGIEVFVSNIEEADEREDTFYLYEHEPFVEYQLKIEDINNNKAHIHLKGIVVDDGYADPYTTLPLEIDCWIIIRIIH